jgi:Flp pilus assembly protein TadG
MTAHFGNPRRRPGTQGAILIEAALVIFVLVLLTFGMIEFGFYVYVMHTTTGAARNGARTAIVSGSTQTQVQSAVDTIMVGSGFTTSQYSVETDDKTAGTSNVDPSAIPMGHDVEVQVKATWSVIGISPMQLISGTQVIDSIVVMRKEG